MSDLINLIVGIAWPVTVLLISVLFRRSIQALTEKNNIQITMPNGPNIKFTSEEAADTLSNLFSDFIKVYHNLLKDDQREVYRRILSSENPPSVLKIFPDFSRDNEIQLGYLRALKGLGLIINDKDGEWEVDSRILLTKFGISLNKYLKSSY